MAALISLRLAALSALSTVAVACADSPNGAARDGSSAAASTSDASASTATSKAGEASRAPAFASCVQDDEPGCKAKCEAGDAESCARLASLYAFGNANVREDLPASVAAYTRACDAGLGKGCYFLGNAHEAGRGVTTDKAKAAELRKKAVPLLTAACDGEPGDAESCSILADLHLTGEGLPKDAAKEKALRKRADVLYGKACDAGDPSACAMYAGSLITAKDGPGAAKAAQKGCDGGDGHACQVVAGIYDEGFEGVAPDPAKARELFALACKRGLVASCSRLRGR